MTAAARPPASRPGPPRPAQHWFQERPSPYTWEQDALDHVQRLMPAAEPYRAWATFSFTAQSGRINECDLLIAVPAGLYLVEIKSHPGRLKNTGSTWNFRGPDRTRTINNPLHLNDMKSKELKSQLQWAARKLGMNDRSLPRVEPAVFLSATDLESHLDEIQRIKVYGRDDGASGLKRIWQDFLGLPPERPERRIKPEFSQHALPQLLKTIGIRQSTAHLRFGDAWKLQPHPLDAGTSWEDRLATRDDGLVQGEGRVRIYLVSQQAADAAKRSTDRAARREYQVLQGINHRGIAAAVEIREHQGGPAILFHHRHTDLRLDQYLDAYGGRLTPEMRLDLVRQLAEAVRYAHNRSLYHRALAARSIYVSFHRDGSRPELRITDWQTAARDFDTNATVLRSIGGSSLDGSLIEDAAQNYLAPETDQPFADPADLDVFGLGAVSYLILTGQPPAPQRSGLLERLRTDSGLRLFAVADGFSDAMDRLVFESTRSDVSDRLGSADRFIDLLDEAEQAGIVPETASVAGVDPLVALPGQSLDAEWSVRRVLGTGATARAVLVERGIEDEDGETLVQEHVFKVALDEEKAERLRAEARALQQVGGGVVVQLRGEGLRELGGRTVLELEYAGEQSLGARLRGAGKLSHHELERFGGDLFTALDQLAAKGVRHRDLKPDNFGLYRRKDRTWQLMLFDFSLADASDRDIKAGTRGYLDPFLGSVRRAHYDDQAERYAAAVTLHEMAGGERPVWGDGRTDPLTVEDAELDVATELFEPALRDGLTAFFRRALHRDTEHRFDTLRQMQDAWREVFRSADSEKPTTTPATVGAADGTAEEVRDAHAAAAGMETLLEAAGLSWRAVSVANGLGATTVGELLDVQPYAISKARGAGALVRRELNRRRKQWAAALRGNAVGEPPAPQPAAAPAGPDAAEARTLAVLSIDEMAARLTPVQGRKGSYRSDAVRLTLGLPPADGGLSPLGSWPVQARIAERLGIKQTSVSSHHRSETKKWCGFVWLAPVRKEIVEIVESTGRVMTARELAAELRVRHGAGNDTPERTRAKALAVVRAAVDAEAWGGDVEAAGEPRLAVHRRGDTVLIAAEPRLDTGDPSPSVLAGYAAALGESAERLAHREPLPGRAAVVRDLRALPIPEGMVPLADTRLVALGAAVAPTAEVTPRLELYPRDLTLDRALRISQVGAGVRREYGIGTEELITRLRARFPDLDLLADGAPEPTYVEMEEALIEARFSLTYDTKRERFYPPALETADTGTSTGTRTSPLPPAALPAAGRDPHSVIKAKLTAAAQRGGFLALAVKGTRLPGVAEAVAAAHPVERVDLGREFLAEFRDLATEQGHDWEKVLRADAGSAPGRIKPGLASFAHAVWNRVEPRLLARAATPRTVLFLHDAGLLARYWDEGGHDLLVRLQGAARRPADDPHGLWLLCPVETRTQVPHLDGRTVEVIGGDGERAYLDSAFIDDLRRDERPGA
ncbi:BREX system serine/threonine kinase PglW [Streptomyces sp. H27-D2]|uniref:BREX system serine/threonine kinase PglW n=1 Tax=Streptomyces sp. H27-D2 TaxID=3046304 RepID=UPI002DBD696A|nr:BREX system serine/threonine kinase PglW [Streptomyces sp. H27-D2]MEC4014955.1 BREX system serine/threonine kinase PglW [Streptomyces sp. H27-D2]